MSRSFTFEYPEIVSRIITSCGVQRCIHSDTPDDFQFFDALWDTGAKMTVISERMAIAIGAYTNKGKRGCRDSLKTINVNTVSGSEVKRLSRIDLLMPEGIVIRNVEVHDGSLPDKIDILIGMDVISLGTFAVSNTMGHTTFSFQIPSEDTIDLTDSGGAFSPWPGKIVTPEAADTVNRVPWWKRVFR